MPLEVPVKQTGLEASIEAAAKKAGRNLSINIGKSAKSIDTLSQPLGRITGKADEFTKSMEAANARVLAFGASVGVLTTVTKAFKDLVTTTIQVEKQLTSINTILGGSASSLSKFSGEIFNVARDTEQSFAVVADAALELSRQGLESEQVIKRLNDALILSRLTGQGAAEAVSGLTAAINSFNSTGITSSEVLNKLSSAAISAAVSERDLIEGIKRSGAVAVQAGVSFDELVGIIGAVQEKTARGGAVIGNSFKTIFTRIQSLDKLETMQNLGVQVTDASGQVLSATKLIQNLGNTLESLPDAKRLQIAENLVGKFQIAPFLAILEDFNSQQSKAIELTGVSQNASTEAYQRNITLNKTLSAAINEASVSLTELANNLGKIGVTDGLKQILDTVNGALEGLTGMFDEKSGSNIAKNLVKGIGNVLSGPGVAIFLAIIGKLTFELAKFGVNSLRTFFGINKAAKEQAALQGSIASSLLNNSSIQKQILSIENSSLSAADKKKAQTKFFTTALNEQYGIMLKMQQIAGRVAPGVMAGTRGRRGAGGYIPSMAMGSAIGSAIGQEQADINRGVGGAPRSANPVPIPNFNFGGGQRGTIVANDSEFIVPSFGGGSAIFNQNMASSMGLPRGAKQIGAAGGYIPNFAKINQNKNLVLFVGNRGKDEPERTLFAGKLGKETRAYTSVPPKDVKNVQQVQVPIFKVGPKGTSKGTSRDIEDIKKGLSTAGANQAKLFAKEISGKGKLPTLTNKQIEGLFNPGAFEGFAGSVFEVSLAAILGSKQFLDYASRTTTARIDLPYSDRLFGKFGAKGIGKLGAEVKATDKTELLKSAAVKFYDVLGGATMPSAMYDKNTRLGKPLRKDEAKKLFGIGPQTYQAILKQQGKGGVVSRGAIIDYQKRRNLAGGYLPSYAGGLEAAVTREASAGIPINQIRINQSGTLRNAGNPMGLAVTNTRDEPTGAIPNFSNGGFVAPNTPSASKSGFGAFDRKTIQEQKKYTQSLKESTDGNKKNTRASGDMLGKIFAVQAGLSLLSGSTASAEEGLGRFTNRLSSGLGSITSAAFAASALKDMGKGAKGVGGILGRFGAKLGLAGAAAFAIKGALDMTKKLFEDFSGETDRLKTGLATLDDAVKKAAGSLDSLSEVEKLNLENVAKEISKESKITVREEIMKVDAVAMALIGTTPMAGPSALGPDDLPMRGTGKFKDVTRDVDIQNIERGGKKLADILIEKMTIALASGKTQEAVQTAFIEAARGSDKTSLFESEDLQAFSKLLNIQSNAEIAEAVKERRSDIEASLDAGGAMTGIAGARNIAAEIASERGLEVEKVFLETAKEANEILKARELVRQKEERVARQVATLEIETAVERAKLQKTDLDFLEQRILKAELSKTLTQDELIALKTEQDIAKSNLGLRNKALDVAAAMVKKSEEITFVGEKELALKANIEKLGDAAKMTDADRNELLEKTKDLLSESDNRIKLKLEKEIQSLETEKQKVQAYNQQIKALSKIRIESELINQQRTILDIGAAGDLDITTREANKALEQGIRGRGLGKTQRETGAFSILQSDALRGLAARDEVSDAMAKSQQAANTTNQQQTEKLTSLISSLGDDVDFLAASIQFRGDDISAGTLAADIMSRGLNVKEVFDRLGPSGEIKAKAGVLSESFDEQNDALKKQAAATLANAQANVEAARFFGLSENQIIEDMATNLRRGTNQAMVDSRLTIDPAARAKGLFSAGRRERKAKALDDGNETLFRQLLQEELLAGQLINASQEFAQNIGNAMLDAISKGESLGDTLLAAASGFFDQMSRALMNNAVNSIISGGPGGAGFFGGFGKMLGLNTGGRVSGGSGVRDDVPALLTGGEFVMNKKAVQNYGAGFMGALNSGAVPKYANGGLFTPGTFGQGSIKGSSNLLRFATQSYTGGMQDQFLAGAGIAGLALEPQSGRLTMFGRRNSPAFQREQDSKRKAFDLFAQQYSKDADRRRQKEQNSGNLLGSILGFGFSLGANALFGGGLSGIFSKGKATGGAIPYSAGVDSVPAMLSGGEFVMNAAATQRLGAGNLAALNSGGGVASGDNSQIVGKLDQLNETIASSNTEINITVNSNGTENTDSPNAPQQQRNLATRIKDVVRQVIEDEKRLGGSLRMA
jgi:TP901 family phage tail tape measure protein